VRPVSNTTIWSATRLAALAAKKGVTFRFDTTVVALERSGGRISGVRIADGEDRVSSLRADTYVVAMGSYSPLLLRPLGMRIPVYPIKGYSVTMNVANPARAHTVSLTDDEYKLVFSRLGDRLRIAGTAELDGYSTAMNETRCRAILRRAMELFPGAGDPATARFWTGLRPATPGNVPIIGRNIEPGEAAQYSLRSAAFVQFQRGGFV
jgi:D-amino-acid dehydrogenase